eukprot:NODE_441_length_8548_cov_0.413185.p5 type:complete len:146 gc:universal NODE_441_length_8548_cov_0.413185:2368-1931(-)
MQKEIDYAVNFLATIIQKHGITVDQVSIFKQILTLSLKKKVEKCWYPNNPIQGSARRAITNLQNNSQVDALLQHAALQAGILDIRALLPSDFVLWIDPHSVIQVLFRFLIDVAITEIHLLFMMALNKLCLAKTNFSFIMNKLVNN